MTVQLLHGDCRDVLKTLESESVHCCICSPPYWGLRSYLPAGHPDKAREIGSEPTVHEWVRTMVEVFREVRRVLRDDGTLWLNLGDSYATGAGKVGAHPGGGKDGERARECAPTTPLNRMPMPGFKPKDLIGQPWRVAFALQQPYYTGRIASEIDRAWLAAMIDAEGCFFIHKRKAGQSNGQGYVRQNDSYSPGLEVANTSLAIVERCKALTGLGSICSQTPEQNGRRRQTIYRWNVRSLECRDIAREVYPHLVAKQHQARLLLGCPSSGPEAEAAHIALIGLHRGTPTDVDFKVSTSLWEPGWYLRQELVWGKKNPMPESVTDRFTKAHEQVFLLSKSERYWFDLAAVQEEASEGTHARRATYKTPDGWDTSKGEGGHGSFHKAGREKGHVPQGVGRRQGPPGNPAERKVYPGNGVGFGHGTDAEKRNRGRVKNNGSFDEAMAVMPTTRNPRSVRWLASEPFRGAHFATYPPSLIEPFVLAGCPPGGTILDPFGGSGTTGLVADRHGRNAILIDIDERNLPMARDRIHGDAPLFAEVAACWNKVREQER